MTNLSSWRLIIAMIMLLLAASTCKSAFLEKQLPLRIVSVTPAALEDPSTVVSLSGELHIIAVG